MNSTLDYSRVLGPGDQHNSYFMIDQNRTLRTTQSLDYESDDHNLSVRIRVRDEHNASLVKVFTIALLDMNDTVVPPTTDHDKPLAPIVQTGNFSTEGNGTYRFEGKILSGEYANILEAGIWIKPADSNDSQLLPADLNGTGGIISVSTKSLNGGKTYFYRAYALTTMGESLGTIRRIEVSDKNDTRHWWSSIAFARTDGWIIDSWMGDLAPLPQPVGLPPPAGMDIHEPGRKCWILDMEAGKRLALDQLIHLAVPMGPRIRRLALPITCEKQSSFLRLRFRHN